MVRTILLVRGRKQWCSSPKDCIFGEDPEERSASRTEEDTGRCMDEVKLWGSFWRQVMEQLKHAGVT